MEERARAEEQTEIHNDSSGKKFMSAWTSTTEVKIMKTYRPWGYVLKVELKIFADDLAKGVRRKDQGWLLCHLSYQHHHVPTS